MESDWAAEHLQTIRTLMERAAIYRRALAPIMLFTGAVGLVATLIAIFFKMDQPEEFIGYWLTVSVLPVSVAYLMVRRQALKEGEPFWSPPTRRVTQALLPPLTMGLVTGLILMQWIQGLGPVMGRVVCMLWLPLGWVALYGCALHAAGFFMPRGMKLFGWIFIGGALVLFAVGVPGNFPALVYAHGIMGLFFGVFHLAYGLYLSYTEKRKNVA